MHLVSDHLYISRQPRRCAEQLVEVARAEAVLGLGGAADAGEHAAATTAPWAARRWPGRPGLYQIERVLEKPTPTKAEQELVVPGLRAGHYLCLFGMHVLTPARDGDVGRGGRRGRSRPGDGRPIMLSPALAKLAQRERYLALELDGTPLQHRREVRHARWPSWPWP